MAALVAGCPDDPVPSDDTGSTGEPTSTSSSTIDPSSDDGVAGTSSTTVTTDTTAADTTTSETDTTAGDPCGNGMLDPGEDCDGRDLAGEDCLSRGFDRGQLACADDCTFDESTCTLAVCGDGVVEGDEPCDGDDVGALTCQSEGFYGGTLGCTPECEPDVAACTSTITYCSMAGFTLIEVGTLVIPVTVPPMAEGPVVAVDISLEATHSFVGFLDVSVEHVPSATSVVLLDNLCGPEDNIDAIFDQDAAAPPACMPPTAVVDHVLPLEDLDAFAGLPDHTGQWEMTIVDSGPGDTDPGLLVEWCVVLEIENGPP